MEVLMSCFFDDFFAKIDRGYLSARYRRQMLAEYISTVIAGCRESDGCEAACKEAVLAALRYHRGMMNGNSQVCMLGKHHNILYIAAKLCYDWNLRDSETVSALLGDMFECEKTFERLVGGAIFGVKMSQMVSGWKSDFNNREENLRALVYFIEHSYKAKSTYLVGDEKEKFVDVPIECCGGTLPVWVCLQVGRTDVLQVFLKYGAKLDTSSEAAFHYIKRLSEYTNRSSLSPDSQESLTLLLRAITSFQSFPSAEPPNFLPDYSTSKATPSLKHLSRITIRDSLTSNFQLPLGVDQLPLPIELISYISLESD